MQILRRLSANNRWQHFAHQHHKLAQAGRNSVIALATLAATGGLIVCLRSR
ncbi:hypothetical protein LQ939_11610 [Pantoea alhagi]|uniref:hypothetical protein n=1 Tax=Pantoea alhagi TaxID=1891675 RepID=UPI00202B0406|nr:hypothetical protein [Pantoea alhagi]URQ59453.1 hypothetical protein LQ939_11610 [Pantoea alhagi]